ncbi:MAG: Hint domain-containing protein [Paracoccaceae bacterium]
MSNFMARSWGKDNLSETGTTGFCGNTLLNTLDFDCFAKDVETGAMLLSRRGAVSVVAVSKTTVGPASMVRIKADAFAPGLPISDVVIGSDTRIRVAGSSAKALNLPDASVVLALMAVNGETVLHEEVDAQTLVRITLDEPGMIYAAGLAVQCQTAHQI